MVKFNKTLKKELFNTIKINIKRYLSLISIIMLGVMFFIGMKSNAPVLRESIVSYLNKTNYMDIESYSLIGISKKEIKKLKEKYSEIDLIEGGYQDEFMLELQSKYSGNRAEYLISAHSYNPNNKINRLYYLQGREVKEVNEVVADASLVGLGYELGDKIHVPIESLDNQLLTIVGFARSPEFISSYKGSSKLSSGKLNYFLYIHEDNFISSNYNKVYIKLFNKYDSFTDEYNKYINEYTNKINTSLNEIVSNRKNNLLDNLESIYNNIFKGSYLINKDGFSIFNKLKRNVVYSFNRNDSYGYSQFNDDIKRVDNLSKILPIVFFVVAALVTASSITRLAEEERNKIGVLKSLGYKNKDIIYKYIYYTFTAGLVGCFFGILFGCFLFPRIFAEVYKGLYYIVEIKYLFLIKYILIAIFLSFISTVIVGILSIKNTLKESPSDLFRPKTRKNNRRLLIERNKKIWDKISFVAKITLRNIFGNKGRSLMTILGISGCTALLVTGLGIRYSIEDIIYKQYGEIFNLNAQLFFNEDYKESKKELIKKTLDDDNDIKYSAISKLEAVNYKYDDKKLNIYLVVPKNLNDFNKLINLYDYKSSKLLNLSDNGVIISSKLAKLSNTKVGDFLTYSSLDNKKYEVKVIGICENYIYHYIFMTSNYYMKLTSTNEVSNNVLLVKYSDNIDVFNKSDEVMESGDFQNVLIEDEEDIYKSVVERFNMILLIDIISAALLAFIVLYNLSKINISENKRDIATLKVLGFNIKETNRFINNEMFILTIIGIIIGLFSGVLLTEIVINTCELDSIMFYHGLSINSLLYASLLTILFLLIINQFIKSDLKKINMVESLKSNE